MPLSEWLEWQLAIADRNSQMIIEIRGKINKAINDLGSSPLIVEMKLRSLLRELDRQ